MTNFRSTLMAAAILLCTQFFATETAAQRIDPLPVLDSLSDVAIFDLAMVLSDQAVAMEADANASLEALTRARNDLDAQLRLAKQDSTVEKSTLNALKSALKRAKKEEKTGKKRLTESRRAMALGFAALEMSLEAQRKQIPLIHQALSRAEALRPERETAEAPLADLLGPVSVGAPDDTSPVAEAPLASDTSAAMPAGPARMEHTPSPAKAAAYDPAADVLLHPPLPPCQIAAERRDAFSGALYRETAALELFRFTNPVMKKALGDLPHIDCRAAMSTQEGAISLHLQFIINDPNARKAFGGLNRGAIAILKFMDGSTYTLNNLRADEGTADPTGKSVSYRGQYALDRTVLKMIQKSELDKLRIAWATGYEDYDIFQVDTLMNLYHCLNTAKP